MRLIDADALLKAIANSRLINECLDAIEVLAVKEIIDNTPTVERPKGKWRSVGFEKGYAFCICSNCGKTTRLYRDSKNEFCCIADIRNKVIACMYCAADMRGEI